MSFSDYAATERRRLILEALADDPDFSIGHVVLVGVMGERGHAVTDVRNDLVWLEEHGLITTTTGPSNTMPQATITPLGEDVAHGHKAFDGVRRKR